MTSNSDPANGYEEFATVFIRARTQSIGPDIVRPWASSRFGPGDAVLDLACGFGQPITEVLVDLGLDVHAVEASPTLLASFRQRFPQVPTECARAEDSSFFDGKRFSGIVAWGLLFLLPPDSQRTVISKAARALRPGGSFLFTAPPIELSWNDAMTGLPSVSLGRAAYLDALAAAGLTLVAEHTDSGENHYYESVLAIASSDPAASQA